MNTSRHEQHQRRKSAKLTLESAEQRRRAARSQADRDMLDGIVDRAKRALAHATAEIERMGNE
jgi:hypothetical protein